MYYHLTFSYPGKQLRADSYLQMQAEQIAKARGSGGKLK